MVKMNKKNVSLFMMVWGVIVFGVLTHLVYAIDNPDAPDLIGEFETREQDFLKKINNPNNGTRDYLIAYDDYLKFLDDELNKAYQLIKSKLPEARQGELKNAQRNWIKFRDAEFELINNNWTRQNFGSSSGISRGSYRSTIVKNRVLQLLHYAKNY